MKIKCPYCEKEIKDNYDTKISTAIANCEAYDTTSFILRCPHCNKTYNIQMERTVNLVSVNETRLKEPDFG